MLEVPNISRDSSSISSVPACSDLVAALNGLLVAIDLPFVLETPQDLTPSLLLAILESILESRLPIPQSIRESRDQPSKVEAMKIFLGVLENDMIQMDVGLSDVDPRKLAAGAWDETVFVGQLLCWLGEKKKIMPRAAPVEQDLTNSILLRPETSALSWVTDVPRHPRVVSPSTRSTATNSINTTLSMHASHTTSATSVVEESDQSSDAADFFPSSGSGQRRTPRCIHEIEEPSFLLLQSETSDSRDEDSALDNADLTSAVDNSTSYCNCSDEDQTSMYPIDTSVRHNGWINEVDDQAEIQSFLASRSWHHEGRSHSHKGRRSSGIYQIDGYATPRRPSGTPKPNVTKHTSPTEHTLALMNERARLLSQLADIKKMKNSVG